MSMLHHTHQDDTGCVAPFPSQKNKMGRQNSSIFKEIGLFCQNSSIFPVSLNEFQNSSIFLVFQDVWEP